MPKVMLIDDDPNIAEVVEIILSKHGFEVLKIFEARRVWEMFAHFQPDVVLLDVNVAGIDGRDVCKELKSEQSPHNHIPVVLFSAMYNLEETYRECNASDFISKPFDVHDLVSKLKKHASMRKL